MTQLSPNTPNPDPASHPPVHLAKMLTQGGPLAWIEHNGQLYVLRITRAGKLILTK